jgi:hypothetical protein
MVKSFITYGGKLKYAVIYHGILTLENVGAMVNYGCKNSYKFTLGLNVIKLFCP